MDKKEPKTAVIVAIIAALGGIIVAIINLNPFSKSEKKPDSGSQPYIYAKVNKVLSGTVVDASTNGSISQASVSIVGRNEQSTTSDNGNFKISFADSTVMEARIRVIKSGYWPYDHSFDLPYEGIIIQLKKQN